MSWPKVHKVACGIMIVAVPVSMWAADSASAMLYAKGTTWINGSAVPRTSAVFPGDLVQTQSDSLANINASGSNVVVMADSLVRFDGVEVSLEHGSLTVATSKSMTTHAGGVTVVPVSNGWTEFEVKQESNGAVHIVAQKGDVNVSDGVGTSTVPQGQQTTVDDSQGKRKKRRKGGGAIPAAGGGALGSPIVLYGGAAAAGGLLTWILLQGGTPVSATQP